MIKLVLPQRMKFQSLSIASPRTGVASSIMFCGRRKKEFLCKSQQMLTKSKIAYFNFGQAADIFGSGAIAYFNFGQRIFSGQGRSPILISDSGCFWVRGDRLFFFRIGNGYFLVRSDRLFFFIPILIKDATIRGASIAPLQMPN